MLGLNTEIKGLASSPRHVHHRQGNELNYSITGLVDISYNPYELNKYELLRLFKICLLIQDLKENFHFNVGWFYQLSTPPLPILILRVK